MLNVIHSNKQNTKSDSKLYCTDTINSVVFPSLQLPWKFRIACSIRYLLHFCDLSFAFRDILQRNEMLSIQYGILFIYSTNILQNCGLFLNNHLWSIQISFVKIHFYSFFCYWICSCIKLFYVVIFITTNIQINK